MTSVEMAGKGPASSRSLCVSSVWGSMSPEALLPDGPFHVALWDAKLPGHPREESQHVAVCSAQHSCIRVSASTNTALLKGRGDATMRLFQASKHSHTQNSAVTLHFRLVGSPAAAVGVISA